MRLFILGIILGGCAPDAGESPEDKGAADRGDCNPVDPGGCLRPYPSSFFLIDDEGMPSGKRMALGEASLPMNNKLEQVEPDDWNGRDGFSINSTLMTHLPGATVEGAVGHEDIGAYLEPSARSVIVDPATATRHPHWLELEHTAPDPTPTADERVVLLRPATAYEWDTTYVVGIQGLLDASGQALSSPEGFVSLREGTASDDPDIEAQRDHYEAVIFPALEAQGMVRGELLMAWSFHTASRENTLGDMETIRDDVLGWATETGGPAYTLDVVEDHDCLVEGEHIARHIEGRIHMPFYTTDNVAGSYLLRDPDGRPMQGGMKDVPFIVRVPCSVAHGEDGSGAVASSAAVLQYGHGLLGSHTEVEKGYLAEVADRYGWVLYASSWTGFKSADAASLTLMLIFEPSRFGFIPEGSHQGMAEFLVGMRMMTTTLVEDEALTFDGQAVIDPEARYFYGNSQGSIMGSAYVAMSPDITRGVFGVGGGPYSLLLTRSKDFEDFFKIFKDNFDDFRDISVFVNGLTQQLWDPVEGAGWVWDMVRDNPEPKQVLLQVAIGDNQVTTLSAHYEARAYGAKLLAPGVRDVWGLDVAEGPLKGDSALIEWHYLDGPEEPVEAVPPQEPDTHECPRRERRAQDQMAIFLETGVIEQTCDGPCESWIEDTCP
jgi:hypothetical protein